MGASPDRRYAAVALIGAPNAGKSTLANTLVGARVSIVTQKAQTTRACIRGITVRGPVQLVFIDTPGIFVPGRTLDRTMVAAAWERAAGADMVVLVADVRVCINTVKRTGMPYEPGSDTGRIIEGLEKSGRKAVLVLNKTDGIDRRALPEIVQRFDAAGCFTDIFMVSARKGDGTDALMSHFAACAPEGPWLYPEDTLSDIPDRLMAAEITREKLFLRLHQELPYDLTVETDLWKHLKSGLRIEQTVYVARSGQKGIVLGKNGQTLKAVGHAARQEMARLFGVETHLFVHVKVRRNWSDDPVRLRNMGLDVTG